jgi:hypothetical protein
MGDFFHEQACACFFTMPLAKSLASSYQQPMKFLHALFAFAVFDCIPAVAQETKTNAQSRIPAADAKQHVNSEKVVFGKVAEIHRSEKLVQINFDNPFPNQPFTAVIFANKTNLFELDKLKGKTVEVKGKITEYREQPQIILLSTNQLKILDSEPATEK